MAVKRVFGRVDGIEVVLSHGEGNRWSVPVPFDRDGEYVVEVIAEDEAGNQSYLARLLYTVDTNHICVHPLPLLKYLFELQADRYQFSRVYPVCQEVAF